LVSNMRADAPDADTRLAFLYGRVRVPDINIAGADDDDAASDLLVGEGCSK
jgi:hypothetical protein